MFQKAGSREMLCRGGIWKDVLVVMCKIACELC